MGYNTDSIAAAFSTVARLVRTGQPVVLSKVEGLNTTSRLYFREAVTHSFNEETHGFNLQRIFIVDKDNPQIWHRNTSPNKNPGDATLIPIIIKAMQWVYAHYTPTPRKSKVIEPAIPVNPLDAFTIEDLQAEIARRQKIIAREELAKKLGVSVDELAKIAEAIMNLL